MGTEPLLHVKLTKLTTNRSAVSFLCGLSVPELPLQVAPHTAAEPKSTDTLQVLTLKRFTVDLRHEEGGFCLLSPGRNNPAVGMEQV